MDTLTPLLNQIALSARVFYSGELCQLAGFDSADRVGHLHLVRAGRLSVRLPGEAELRIKQPSLIFFPRPCDHALAPDDESGIDLVCASIDLGAGVGSPLARALPKLLVLPIARVSSLESTLELLFAEAFDSRSGRQAALDRLAEYFLIQVLRFLVDSGSMQGGLFAALADIRLAKAMNAMHERPAHAWTLETLAYLAGMSRARFAANFRATVGTTPLDYLTDWRLSVAQNLLKQGKPIKLVAPSVGYQSAAALSRVFARRTGSSPSAWLQDRAPPALPS